MFLKKVKRTVTKPIATPMKGMKLASVDSVHKRNTEAHTEPIVAPRH